MTRACTFLPNIFSFSHFLWHLRMACILWYFSNRVIWSLLKCRYANNAYVEHHRDGIPHIPTWLIYRVDWNSWLLWISRIWARTWGSIRFSWLTLTTPAELFFVNFGAFLLYMVSWIFYLHWGNANDWKFTKRWLLWLLLDREGAICVFTFCIAILSLVLNLGKFLESVQHIQCFLLECCFCIFFLSSLFFSITLISLLIFEVPLIIKLRLDTWLSNNICFPLNLPLTPNHVLTEGTFVLIFVFVCTILIALFGNRLLALW